MQIVRFSPENKYLFKVNNGNVRTMCEICSNQSWQQRHQNDTTLKLPQCKTLRKRHDTRNYWVGLQMFNLLLVNLPLPIPLNKNYSSISFWTLLNFFFKNPPFKIILRILYLHPPIWKERGDTVLSYLEFSNQTLNKVTYTELRTTYRYKHFINYFRAGNYLFKLNINPMICCKIFNVCLTILWAIDIIVLKTLH